MKRLIFFTAMVCLFFFMTGLAVSYAAGDEEKIINAVKQGNAGEIEKLLKEKPALLNVKDAKGETLLHIAAKTDNTAIVNLLLKKGININIADGRSMTALHQAIMDRSGFMARFLVENGADVNARDRLGVTPLGWLATVGGDHALVELLISKGANINAKNNNGQTALQLAEANGHKNIAEILKKHGAK